MRASISSERLQEGVDIRTDYISVNRTVSGSKRSRLLIYDRISRVNMLIMGVLIMGAVGLCLLISKWFLLILAAMAVNLIQFSFTGYCAVKILTDSLIRRYSPDVRQDRNRQQEDSE